MLRNRLAQAAAVLALAAAIPLAALAAAPASASRVDAAAVHNDNMIWQ